MDVQVSSAPRECKMYLKDFMHTFKKKKGRKKTLRNNSAFVCDSQSSVDKRRHEDEWFQQKLLCKLRNSKCLRRY